MSENRAFKSLPKRFQTDFNKKQMSVSDDILFEPEDFSYIDGQIGDENSVTDREKARIPFIRQADEDRQKTQLSTAAVYTDDLGNVKSAAFYDDLVGHIQANGGLATDASNLFECDYYSFNPPIDVDKWTNFQKYHWTGPGTASQTGDFITKDAEGSQVRFHRVENDGSFTAVPCRFHLSGTRPTIGNNVGDLIEDLTTKARNVYSWLGSSWELVTFTAFDSLPETAAGLTAGKYIYVARSGAEFQRPVIMHFSPTAGRFISKTPMISLTEPETPVNGMIWEDCRVANARTFMLREGDQWLELTYTASNTFTPNQTGYIFDARPKHVILDKWSANNWWVHYDDLSIYDRVAYGDEKANRPIISFWQGIESYPDDVKSSRNQSPLFNVYMFNGVTLSKEYDEFYGNTILNYDPAQNRADTVLDRMVSYDQTGELLFKLTLESEKYSRNGAEVQGYKFFKDTYTGKFHYIWTKSTKRLEFDEEKINVPLNLSNNPNHDLTTGISRRVVIEHYKSILSNNSTGLALGSNTYRWTDKNPVNGAVIIDTEGSLLLNLITLLDDKFDIPSAIRSMGAEYSKFYKRFMRKLTQFWEDAANVTPTGALKNKTTGQALDEILSQIFVNVSVGRPFYLSDMGTFFHSVYQKQVPIMVPASTARIGATAPYKPAIVDGKILCHNGAMVKSFGDARDAVVLALENRFFSRIPSKRTTETTVNSALLNKNYFEIARFVGDRTFVSDRRVNNIVQDYTAVVSPTLNYTVWSRLHGTIAIWQNGKWIINQIQTGAKITNEADGKLYTFNGYTLLELKPYNTGGVYDYTINEYKTVIRREFEKWYTDRDLDPVKNVYDGANPFTWNYSSSGLEGHWAGMYRRIYRTDRPHLRPWEILGFSIKPSWFDSVYPVSSGNVYAANNPMWADLKTGVLALAAGIKLEAWQLLPTDAKTPVNAAGRLVDPVGAGLVDLDALNAKSDGWSYGDGGPVETDFLYSHEGRFAIALAGYLLKPARFVEFLWSDYSFSIGDKGSVFGGEVMVNDDTFRRRNVTNVSVHASDNHYTDSGLNSWISEKLLITGYTPKTLATVIKNSRVSLGWQVNGFVSENSTVIKTSSGVEVPFEDVSVILHKSQPFETLFHSGINVIKRGSVYQVYGYDVSRPSFTTLTHVKATIGGQTEQQQTFIATEGQKTFTLTEFKIGKQNDLSDVSVLVDGHKVPKPQVTIYGNSTVGLVDYPVRAGSTVKVVAQTYISATPYTAKTFKVGDKSFMYFDQPTTKVAEYAYGYTFENPEEVVQFLVDHQNYLVSKGFIFEDDDWIGVAKRFAVWTQAAKTNTVFADVPNNGAVKVATPFGAPEDFKTSQNGSFNIVDIAGRPVEDYQTYKFSKELSVKSETAIFGLRIVLRSYQHAVFISNRTKFNDLIYDSFSGLRQRRMFVNTIRSNTWSGRLETPGYIIDQNGMIPNLEKMVKDVSKLYNTVDMPTDVSKVDQSLSLYNWFYNDYMKEMNVSRNMAFDYHKHMIREKGTRRSLVAFSKAKANTTDLEIAECWAWKLADFGQERVDAAEIKLFDTDFKKKIQTFIFGGTPSLTDTLVESYSDNPGRWVTKPKGQNISLAAGAEEDIILTVNENGIIRDRLVHYDPVNNFYDPLALSQIDITTAYDPAYYEYGAKVYPGFEWGNKQVGTVWWDTSKLEYEDYHNPALSLEECIDTWGELKKHAIQNVVDEGSEYVVTFKSPHGFNAGDAATILMDVDYKTYNAYVMDVENSLQVRVILINELMDTMFAVDNDHLRFKYMRRADVEVYEWIESTKTPFDYVIETKNLIKYGAIQTYSSEIRNGKTYYYFWVKGLSTPARGKKISAQDIITRLRSPSSSLISWFGVRNSNELLVDTTSFTTKTNLSLSVAIEPVNFENNCEWAIIPENDHVRLVPDYIISKLIDSLTLKSEYGKDMPYFSDAYGNGHGQVMFRDVDKAKNVFLATLNDVFAGIYVNAISNFSRVFNTTDFWEYINYDLIGYTPAQYVMTIQDLYDIRDARVDDVIVVERARTRNGVFFKEGYRWNGEEWELVQSESGSVKFNTGVFDVIRTKFTQLMAAIPASKANSIVFAMLDEMLIQNPDCDWYFKTSLIDVRNFVDNTNYTVSPIDDTATIFKNIQDVKPYHTKVRNFLSTHNIFADNFEYDTAKVQIEEFYEQKITLYYDRLSCNLFDDLTYDTVPFDTTPFDYATWDRPMLATEDWATIATFQSSDTTTYQTTKSRKFLSHRLMTFDGDGNIVPTPIYTIRFNGEERVTIEFTAKPPLGYTFNLQGSSGTASPELLSTTRIDENFYTAPSTYEHAAAVVRPRLSGVGNDRKVTENQANQLSGCANVDQADGGDSAERVRAEIKDLLSITVTTSRDRNYGGFDLQPFDWNMPWDIPVAAGPDEVVVINVDGTLAPIPASEAFVTSTTTTITSTNNNRRVFRAPHGRYTITAIEIKSGTTTRTLTSDEYTALSPSAVKIRAYLYINDTVTLYYGKVQLRSNQIRISNPWTKNYSISEQMYIVYDSKPLVNKTLTVSYVNTVSE